MIDAYEIGVSLVLNDEIQGALSGVADKFGTVQESVDKINASLKQTGAAIGGISSALGGLTEAFNAAARAAETIRGATSGIGAGGAVGGVLPPAGDYPAGGPMLLPADSSGVRYAPYPGSENALTVTPGNGPTGPDRWGWTPKTGYGADSSQQGPGWDGSQPNFTTGGGASGQDESFDNPNAPRRPVPLYPNQSHGITPMDAMSTVFVAQAATGMVAGVAKGLTSPAFNIQDQQINLRNMGAKPGDISQAMAVATRIQQQNPGMTIGQALAMIANLYSVDRNMGEVTGLAPGYARDGYIMSHAQGGADANDQLYSLLRSSEELGKLNLLNKDGTIDTSRAMSFIDLYTRLVANSNGNLTGAGALTMIGQAGPGATQLSDTALERMIIASQALGPSQTGTGLNAMYQEFIGGKMSQATARALHDAHVLPDYMFGPDGKVLKKYRYGIGQVMLPTGALKDEQEALTDPVEWANTHLFGKYLNADGTIKQGDDKAVEGLIADLNKDFSRIPGMKLAGNAIFNSVIQDRAMGNAAAMAPLAVLAANDASAANSHVAGAGAAFNAFLAALGSPLIPGATKGLTMLTGGLNDLTNAANAHPAATAEVDVIAGIGALWGLLKLGSKFKPNSTISKVAGATADGVGEVGGLAGLIALAVQQLHEMYDMPLPFTKGASEYNAKIRANVPSGTRNDPVHVVVAPPTSAAPMPNGQTGYNHSRTMPAPGQQTVSP